MIRIVHVTAHLGGGIGRILSSVAIYSKDEYEHIIITLEPTQNNQFEKLCVENNVKVFLASECNMEYILGKADIVQVDWWHHPLTSQFMVKYLNKVPCRLLIWSHISGCSYPNIPYKLVLFPDRFVFTTPFSYENPTWSSKERNSIIENSDVVVSSGIDIDKPVKKRKHNEFNVGYVGFLSYTKTHPDFIKYCEASCNIPNIRFIVEGDKSYGVDLINDSQNSKILKNKIMFTGYSLDVLNDLSKFDVFGYPLNPDHYGTAENALLEAMAAGIVPVVLNQCTEKYIVQNMKTGLVVNNISEYADALKWLYNNPDKRDLLGYNASKYIIREYNIKTTIKKLNREYEKTLKYDKSLHDASKVIGKTPYEWFLSCYRGDVNNINGTAFAETKGSAKHYLKYFNKDIRLRKVVEKNESRNKTKC